jgi:hypothetical protein
VTAEWPRLHAPDGFVRPEALRQLRPGRVGRRLASGLRPRVMRTVVGSFYADRLGWVALAVAAVVLTYGGGAAMFWFHAIYLGEGGPRISPWLHWSLDSTAGFVGLTPPIALILPVAAWLSAPANGSINPAGSRRPFRFALIGGILLALVAAPGPILHDNLIGRGTWLADEITERWGGHEYYHSVGVPYHAPVSVKIGQQIAAGVVIYVSLLWTVVHVLRLAHPPAPPPRPRRAQRRWGS